MDFKTPLLLLLVAFTSCGTDQPDLVQDNFSFASTQLKQAFVEMVLYVPQNLEKSRLCAINRISGPSQSA